MKTTTTATADPAKKQPEAAPYKPRKSLPITCKGGDMDTQGRATAEMFTSPELAAFRVIAHGDTKQFSTDIDNPTMLETLRSQAAAVQRGDMSQAEAMLINQATALQTLFASLTERGMSQTIMGNIEGFMRLALRAQNQCRATLETLGAIKNPPIIYAKQVNQTTGPQQINNGSNGAGAGTQVRESEIEQSQQSGGNGHELLQDTRTPALEERINPPLETVGAIDRAKDARGQG